LLGTCEHPAHPRLRLNKLIFSQVKIKREYFFKKRTPPKARLR